MQQAFQITLEAAPIYRWIDGFIILDCQLAQKAGIAQSALARLEKSNSTPRTSTLKKLANAMGISFEQLTY
ncbi:MAG: helix-turn-helix transcriptional regulator [SAR324 cluster bacterium]|nr:helix-turn-helix transcriptional regulator [SAR324 cluster bacterium]